MPSTITLQRRSATTFELDSGAYFPLDAAGWVAAGAEPLQDGNHNFSFTSVVRHYFEYNGTEELIFRGDDDVWVFINGRLAVDIGNVHGATQRSIVLDPPTAASLGMHIGGVYEVAVFHAERQRSQSNFRLTLINFVREVSECSAICGDGFETHAEVCDDGVNDGSYDGCMPGCLAVGPYCGNGVVDAPTENCDDGNTNDGDGCPATCFSLCGNGAIDIGEACDDGNLNDGDGCNSICTQVAPGWSCAPGYCYATACGDDIVAGVEECEDGNVVAGDGCDDRCRLEDGFRCDTPGAPCISASCGNGIREGTENCDDGNFYTGDGCTPLCTLEPSCSAGSCSAVCGDGVIYSGEECDDGNFRSGDGCSSTCEVETGYTCNRLSLGSLEELGLPIVYRDIRGWNFTGGHPDFNRWYGGVTTGLVEQTLASDGYPVWSGQAGTIESQDSFYAWYHDTPFGYPVVRTLLLTRLSEGTFEFDSGSGFFPLDGLGWVAEGSETHQANNHNFSFTSAVRHFFEYEGTEELRFLGDDDVWVFINGQLAVDLGNLHGPASGSITLDPATAASLGMVVGGVYEMAVFHAERQQSGSNFRLTLINFSREVSQCELICGDGFVTLAEVCDDGVNDGSRDGCMPGCLARGPYCGDGVLDPEEDCDDGNTDDGDNCPASCIIPCGDGVLASDEACDDGNRNDSDGCSSACVVESGYTCADGPCRPIGCGDGIIAAPEECEDGNSASGDGCDACRLEEGWTCPGPGLACTSSLCGDGVIEGLEDCDDGNNYSGDGCTPLCTREPSCSLGSCVPTCGDGVVEPGEGCDDGNLRGGDGCSALCAVEPGFVCLTEPLEDADSITLPIVYRDLQSYWLTNGHPDFGKWGDNYQSGLVESALSASGYPVRVDRVDSTIESDASFYTWYHDSDFGYPITTTLTLERDAPGVFSFDSGPGFFPLDGAGWVGAGIEATQHEGHNFSFTSHVRHFFEYRGTEQLVFRGDDDVWVFINGALAVDIGGVHIAREDSITLDPATGASLGMTVGGIYELAIFHAERQQIESNFRITLTDFSRDVSRCSPICGDGYDTYAEVCDDGVNDGSYDGCMAGCQALGPYCGDGVTNGAEACDDGNTVDDDDCTNACENPSGPTATCPFIQLSMCESGPCAVDRASEECKGEIEGYCGDNPSELACTLPACYRGIEPLDTCLAALVAYCTANPGESGCP